MAILNRYENFQFPQYAYREYPKWVKPNGASDDAQPVLVKNRLEEDMVHQASASEAEAITKKLNDAAQREIAAIGKSNDRDSLLEKAGNLGIVADRRWSIDTLKNAILNAEAAKELADQAAESRKEAL